MQTKTFEERVADNQEKYFGLRYRGACLGRSRLQEHDARKIATFLDKRKNFLILSGAAGCGKTYIVAAMMEWMMQNFNHFRVWREYDLLKRLREGIEMGWEATDTLIRLIDDDVIIYDDLGSQGHNDWREKIMLEFLDIRYNSEKPTIFTTNLGQNDFEKIYGERIADRLFAEENLILDLSKAPSLRKQGL